MKQILVFFSFYFSLLSYSQQFNFIGYSVADGLAQSQVTDICQDKEGYLWIGTESSGLSRFDGIDFVNYSMDDGLADNKIEKLYYDSQDRLWVATSEGMSLFEDHKFTSFLFNEPLRINDICEFKGQIYLASNTGLVKFIDEKFERVAVDDDSDLYLRSIENYKDSILICGAKTGLYVWKENMFSPFPNEVLSNKNIWEIRVFNQQIYISAHRVGIYTFDFLSNKEKLIDLEYTRIRTFCADSLALIGVTNGFGAFSLEEGKTYHFNNLSGLPTNNLNCIFRDVENNIWIGTDGKGLLKYSGKSIISFSTKDKISSDQVVSIEQDHEGNYMFGTYGAGLTKMHKDSSFSYLNQQSGISDNTIWSLAVDKFDMCWIGTAHGVTLIDKQNRILDHPLKDIDTKIRSIIFVNDSTYLFGGDDGLFIIKNDSLYNLHADFNIYKLLIYKDHVYSAGTNGLFEFDINGDFKEYEEIVLPQKGVKSIAGDFLGNLWIGTENGLFVMDENRAIIPYSLDPGEYNSKTILGLIVNHEGDIWVSTMNGVYEIITTDANKKETKILHYGIAEGLIDLECNENALYEDYNHNIWIGTSSGLARIDPSLNNELFDFKKPMLHITGIRLFMEEFNYSTFESDIDEVNGIPVSITFPHNKNHLTFDFIGINLKDPKSVNYQYRLTGTNDDWSPISETRYATYSFLQPGEYNFEVRARNKNYQWSEINSIHIVILSPFWRTWWFILIMIMFVLVMIIFVFQVRIKGIKQKQENERLEFKNRLLFLEQQSLNASMNRHFIFNSLNSIQYFINSSDKVSANKYLSSFAKLIRKNLDSSSANNFIVTLQEEIERVELYLSLEKMRFQDKFDYKIDVSSALDTEGIEIPSMILQPFVENSIIHGVLPLDKKGSISIRIFEEFDEVVFEVIDDGLGFDNSMKLKKDSLVGDHKSRGMDITNSRIDLLRKLTGENLLIIGPFQLNNEAGECLGTKVIIKMSMAREV